ncbi:MAG: GMC oxidoreductase [Paracoccaceae bacterium]
MTDVTARIWDVIVIGTGMGGGTLGRALAERGLSVLFLEKGPAGYRSEETRLSADVTDPVARHLRGFWPAEMQATVDGIESRFFAPLGCGVGGSSVFYAATLERPEEHDLDDRPERPHPTQGWPVSHAQMAPWLARAETMFAVCGEPDPLTGAGAETLRSAPPLDAGETAMMQRMRQGGLHPYRLHSALRHVEGCRDCLGSKCPLPCKMDGRSAGVEPALATGQAVLLDHAEVTRICGGAGAVSHLEVMHRGQSVTLRARTYVLAAGALASPRLLLASANEAWPKGCANDSGMVGRNLMFHLNEMFAIWPSRRAPGFAGPTKAIGFRDLYFAEGQRFGMVQAMGIAARQGEILYFLRMMLARSRLRRVPGLGRLAMLPAALAARMLGEAQIFVGLLEDLPYEGNRVTWAPEDGDTIRLTYSFQPEVLARRKRFRRLIRRALRGQRHLFLAQWPELNFGHPCGTLRFGTDPATSVLDADCRAHGLSNLYVADGSFMPTSMGVNPSLTIAANALRVADRIAQRMKEGGHA